MNYSRSPWRQRLKYLFNLPQSVRLVWHLLWDKRVPSANKGLFLLIVLFYLVLPTDFLPDFIPFVGQIDDLGVILFMMDQFINRAPAQVVSEYIRE